MSVLKGSFACCQTSVVRTARWRPVHELDDCSHRRVDGFHDADWSSWRSQGSGWTQQGYVARRSHCQEERRHAQLREQQRPRHSLHHIRRQLSKGRVDCGGQSRCEISQSVERTTCGSCFLKRSRLLLFKKQDPYLGNICITVPVGRCQTWFLALLVVGATCRWL